MDRRTAMTMAGALVLAMMAGIVAREFTLRSTKPPPIQIVVQAPSPAQPAQPAPPAPAGGNQERD